MGDKTSTGPRWKWQEPKTRQPEAQRQVVRFGLQEGKPQNKRGALVSSRGPESPGPPNTGAEERGRGHH